jgi:hypothetical protein
MTRPIAFLLVVCALVPGGCSKDDEVTPTAPSAPAVITQYFTGSLEVGGSRFFSFTNTATGTGTFMLASVTSQARGTPVSAVLGLGTGIPAGTGCAVTESANTSATLQVQHTRVFPPGIYCVSVWDTGQLNATINFALRFTHP